MPLSGTLKKKKKGKRPPKKQKQTNKQKNKKKKERKKEGFGNVNHVFQKKLFLKTKTPVQTCKYTGFCREKATAK